MKKLTINRQVEKKIHKGYKILEKSDFEQLPFDNEVVDLVTASGHFLGTGYLSEQNKGLGWVISTKKITLDQAYFGYLFAEAKSKRQSYYQSELDTAFRIFNQEGDGFGGLTMEIMLFFLSTMPLFIKSESFLLRLFKKFFQRSWEDMKKSVLRIQVMSQPIFLVKKLQSSF